MAAFEEFGIQVIEAITLKKNNVASQNLLLKLGLSLIGTKFLPGYDDELLVYAIENSN